MIPFAIIYVFTKHSPEYFEIFFCSFSQVLDIFKTLLTRDLFLQHELGFLRWTVIVLHLLLSLVLLVWVCFGIFLCVCADWLGLFFSWCWDFKNIFIFCLFFWQKYHLINKICYNLWPGNSGLYFYFCKKRNRRPFRKWETSPTWNNRTKELKPL